MLLCHSDGRMAEDVADDADVLWGIGRDRGRGDVAEGVRSEGDSEDTLCQYGKAVSKTVDGHRIAALTDPERV